MAASQWSVLPIFKTSSFIGGFVVNALITGVVNYSIDWYNVQKMLDSPDDRPNALVVVQPKTVADVLIFVLIVALATFYLGSPSVIKNILAGKSRPIAATVLAENPFHRVVGSRGQRSALRFVVYCLFFPGALVCAAMTAICRRSLQDTDELRCEAATLDDALLLVVVWKSAAAAVVYVLNYIACHNDSQPVLQEKLHAAGAPAAAAAAADETAVVPGSAKKRE